MAAVKKRKTADAWKKKEWYTILSPKNFDEKEIGMTPAIEPDKLANRVIKTSLREITGSMGHQFIRMHFRVTDVKGKAAHTEFDGFELVREYLRRNVRRRRSMIRVVREITTKDGKKASITVYTFTARKEDTSKKDLIRKIMMQTIDRIASENDFESLVQRMLFGSMATDIFKEVRNVVQIKRVEIAKCKLPSGK
jgi:small subunit ribosomal protein S3Ae